MSCARSRFRKYGAAAEEGREVLMACGIHLDVELAD